MVTILCTISVLPSDVAVSRDGRGSRTHLESYKVVFFVCDFS